MPNVRLSESRIEALEPRKSAYDVRDADLKGFGIRVLSSGSKRFFVHSQHEGQRIWKTVGDAGSTGLDEARRRATALLAAIRRDEEATASPEEKIFEAVAEEVFDGYGRYWKPRTRKVNRGYLRNQILTMVRRAEHRRNHAAGRAAMVRIPARDAGGGGPVRADSVRHHAPGRDLWLPAGRQQSLHRHPALPAQGPRTLSFHARTAPALTCAQRA